MERICDDSQDRTTIYQWTSSIFHLRLATPTVLVPQVDHSQQSKVPYIHVFWDLLIALHLITTFSFRLPLALQCSPDSEAPPVRGRSLCFGMIEPDC